MYKKLSIGLLLVILVGALGIILSPRTNQVVDIEKLYCVTGLNGNQVCYTEEQINNNNLVEIEAKDTFDKTKAPSYMLDETEEYVSFQSVMNQLKFKYFNYSATSEDDVFMGAKAYVFFNLGDEFTLEENLARAVLMIEELRMYEFYILSSSEFVLQFFYEGALYEIKIPLVVMVNDMFEITPDGILSEDYEMELFIGTDYTVDRDLVQQYYDDFVTNETFLGYVLNYTK